MEPPGAPRRAPQAAGRFNAAAFFVDRHPAEGRGNRTAFRYRGRSVSYGELAEQVNRAGNALAERGVEMEHRVLLALDDSPAIAAVFWGAAKIGAVAVPVNPATRPDELAFRLEDSRARVAVVEPDVAPAALPDLAPAPTVAEDTLYWSYTSGPTGRPKAAVHPHEDFVTAGWQERFDLELLDVVDSTEALHDFIANRPGGARRGSAGRLVPGFEARLVDDEGRPVSTGAVGLLLIKGPTTAPYYWHRRERTRATMLGEWLRTGDMFRQDADGHFFFAGRADDMLKVGGQWVAPAEVEAVPVAHPAVVEATVVGRPDGDGLTRPAAFVVLAPGRCAGPAFAEELRTFARERLPGFKVPAWVEVVDELPKTVTGKVQRFRLRG
jgi:acyl-coenzyme A synthetase/AMP-(fatty) acid ligase